MLQEDQIVLAYGRRQVKIGLIFREWARCCSIDAHGFVSVEWFDVANLTPMRHALQPRTAWPEGGQLDQLIAERETQQARSIAVAEKAKRRSEWRKLRRRAA